MPAKHRAHGEGSVYQVARTGRWVAAITMPDGRRVTRTRKTKREAQIARADLLRQQEAGAVKKPVALTVAALMAQYLEDVSKPAVRPRTYESYEARVRKHLVPYIGSVQIVDLTPQRIQQLQSTLIQSGLAPSTVNISLTVLGMALRQAEDWELIPRNPMSRVKRIKAHAPKMPRLTAAQGRAILTAFRGTRMEGVVMLALALGLRKGEVMGVRWIDVDEHEELLSIRGQLARVPLAVRTGAYREFAETKTPEGERVIPLPAFVLNMFTRQRERQANDRATWPHVWRDTGYVFTMPQGGPLHHREVTQDFRDGLARAGIPRIRFHHLRHGASSLLASLGVDLRMRMEILGHRSMSVALHYTETTVEERRAALNRLSDLLGGGV